MKNRSLLCLILGVCWIGVVFCATPLLADDIAPPTSIVKLIFIHHSTGGNWLADSTLDSPSGGLAYALKSNNYFVSAANYGWGPDGIGDRTDIPNWPEWFTGPNSNVILNAVYKENGQNVGDFGDWSRLAGNPAGDNEVIVFKSCFPNSDLYGEATDQAYAEPNDWEYSVANAKAVYSKLLSCFSARQNKLFIVITAPPLAQAEYASGDQPVAKRAANVRAFNNWLVKDWLQTYPFKNVAVFDYYNVLTSNGGNADANDLERTTGNHHRWWQGAIQHMQSLNNNYAAYPSGDSHPSSAGHRKATQEFLPLLNIFYHRWKSGTLVHGESSQSTPYISHRAYPNPFNAQVAISFFTSGKKPSPMIIYNMLGEKIVHLDPQGMFLAGEYRFNWNGQDDQGRSAATGVYFYRVKIGQEHYTGKILLAR